MGVAMTDTTRPAVRDVHTEVIFSGATGPGGSHERVLYGHDAPSGLRTIIAVHSTLLGRALGGTRFFPYDDERAALVDVLRLSRGMTYKAAAAGLNYGGGKAVIIGDPATDKTPALLEAYGRLVDSLGGQYITGGDVGTTSDDMDVVGRSTTHVLTRTEAAGGSGDSGPMTALGTFHALRAAAKHTWGEDSLAGRRVGVEGVGKVGHHLVGLLVEHGATVLACDVSDTARDRLHAAYPDVQVVDRVLDADVDVYAPCALGSSVTSAAAEQLRARIVCGAANNQLAEPCVEELLQARRITWIPDYVASAGGLIQGSVELEGKPAADTRARVEQMYATVDRILTRAAERATTAGAAAHELAQDRLDAAAAARSGPR
jgi:valine dehydrogenase (NAD+)